MRPATATGFVVDPRAIFTGADPGAYLGGLFSRLDPRTPAFQVAAVMAAAPSQMTAAIDGDTAYLAVSGRACAEGARDFKRFVEDRRRAGVRCVVLDLSRCLLMDSTFSGVLAGLIGDGQRSDAPGEGLRFVISSANDRVTDLLDNLGVLPLLQVLPRNPPPPAAGVGIPIPCTGPDRRADTECCLDAHRHLMALRPENAGRFAMLEKFLVDEMARSDSKEGCGEG